ncbi:hypothetical protein K0T92_09920 [Paenibacillus oenotherae]|uniref:Uncharacterized protein n=1 Tax=Paenibacillus oenotherae TaxID=1435645 RepID=A0ABS7D5K7_9BACL|nr:hypothetical protein [Paenibacillus oenotherae]MBW7475063.1 hypothetical protein [Paenibacillus oenotherae]
MKILYSKYTRERLAQFQLETSIYEVDGRKMVRKRALTPSAREHVENIHRNSVQLGQQYSNVSVLVPEIRGNELHYPFIEGESWDHKLHRLIVLKDKERFIAELRDFVRVLNGLQTPVIEKFISDEGFHEVFGVQLTIEDSNCLMPANIDLIFDNVISDGEGNIVILDCEWVFPFKIPSLYIIWRSVYAFWVKHQYEVRALFEFEELCDVVGITQDKHNIFLEMEETHFQKYVHGIKDYTAYEKKGYTTEQLVQTTLDNQVAVGVYLPVDRVYTYVKELSINAGEQYQNLVYSFEEKFDDHIRIDPANFPALIEVKAVQLQEAQSTVPAEVANTDNHFEGITFSDDLIRLESADSLKMIALSDNSHLFFKINRQITGDFHVKISMRVIKVLPAAVVDYIISSKQESTVLEQEKQTVEDTNHQLQIELDEMAGNVAGLEKSTAELMVKLDSVEREKEELERTIEELESRNRELLMNVQLMENSHSWKLTAPLRAAQRTWKKNR